jgi:quercetin dioxygenase-like cupin family protein
MPAKPLPASTACLILLAAAPALAQQMDIKPGGSQPATQGAEANFTGMAIVTPLFAPNAPSRSSGGQVIFEPGARSAWHTHPAGQVLIITSGVGWIQEWNGPKHEVRPGDVVWTPPGVKHWHGATATSPMSHIAIQDVVDGRNVDWMEKVSDGQYGGQP